MGYFDGLTDAIFKTDSQGRYLYYRWGILSKGHVLPDEAAKTRIRKFVKVFYIATMLPTILMVPVVNAFVINHWSLARALATLGIGEGLFVVGSLAFYQFWTERLVNGLPISEEKLRVGESYANSARSHNLPTLIVLLLCSALFVASGLWLMSRDKVLIGASGVAFFGVCSIVIGYMLKTKLTQKD